MKFSALIREAKYNVLCDEYSSQTLEVNKQIELPYPRIRAMLAIGGEWIKRNYKQNFNKAAMLPVMKEYI